MDFSRENSIYRQCKGSRQAGSWPRFRPLHPPLPPIHPAFRFFAVRLHASPSRKTCLIGVTPWIGFRDKAVNLAAREGGFELDDAVKATVGNQFCQGLKQAAANIASVVQAGYISKSDPHIGSYSPRLYIESRKNNKQTICQRHSIGSTRNYRII